ncbi:MAG TPA: hypothetical protein VIQ60_11530, partial [Gemmatimonadaceae bacterium]
TAATTSTATRSRCRHDEVPNAALERSASPDQGAAERRAHPGCAAYTRTTRAGERREGTAAPVGCASLGRELVIRFRVLLRARISSRR